MWLDKRKRLKSSYYRIFFALIVIPILFIILISIAVLRTMMMDSAIRSIRRAQDNIVSTLGNEVKDVSLRLSHFVYVNDNEIMKLAARTDTEDPEDRYRYTGLLTESFHYAMVPVSDVISAVFYMKDGEHTYMKDDIILSMGEIKASGWYQEALADPNMVKMGYYDTNVTYSRRISHSLTLVAALAPGPDLDRDGAIEMAALFVSSDAGNLIKDYNKEKELGLTMVMKADGTPVFDTGGVGKLLPQDPPLWEKTEFHSRVNNEHYVYVISEEPVTGLKVVSAVASSALTKDFNRIAAAIIGVTLVLFFLFYLFSSYFLRSIIEPIHTTVEAMKRVEEGSLEVHIDPKGQAELRTMIHSFNRMIRRLKQLMQDNEEEQQKKHEAEIKALQSQINPHFLVNSLNSIRFIAQVSRYEAIAKMAEALIKILSCSFRSNAGFYTLREELEVLDGFIYLMKIRYSDGFEVKYELDDIALNCLVPRLILQPLVENSIVHGFDGMEEELGLIRLTASLEGEHLVLMIEDNGKGMEEETLNRLLSGEPVEEGDYVSVGIYNVFTRLNLNYGSACSFGMKSRKGSYTKTVIRLPVQKREEENV